MPILSFASFMGPTYICVWISFILYGLLLAQTYVYFATYNDHVALKILVWVICILETLLVALCMHVNYIYTIIDFANPERILNIIWSIGAAIYLELVISGIVQSFYIYRIWRLRQARPLLAYLAAIFCARMAVGFKANSYACTSATWEILNLNQTYRQTTHALNITSSAMLLHPFASTLIFLLRERYSLAHKRSTKHIVHRLMEYTLSSGMLTMITSVVILILFNVSKGTLHYAGLLLVIAKLYANSMLGMLNVRQSIKQHTAVDGGGFTVELSHLPSQAAVRPDVVIGKVQVTHDTFSSTDGTEADDKQGQLLDASNA